MKTVIKSLTQVTTVWPEHRLSLRRNRCARVEFREGRLVVALSSQVRLYSGATGSCSYRIPKALYQSATLTH